MEIHPGTNWFTDMPGKGNEEINKFTFKRDHKSVLAPSLQELQSQGKLIFPVKEGILTQPWVVREGVDEWRS